MCRLLGLMLRWVFVAVVALAGAYAARAQGVQLRLLEERADGVVFEMTASWPMSLRAALDSVRADVLDERAALAVSRGGLFDVAETLRLPSLAMPRVRVLASDYDEVRLPAAADAAALVAALKQRPAAVLGLGLERKRPAATLRTRLLTYDDAQGTLRRYRRLVVAVDYAARGAGPALSQTALRAASDNPHLRVSQSVLADGVVFKIALREEGVYRIDRAFLTSLPGFDLAPGSIDPNTVKVYGNGGVPLPALNSAPRLADLTPNQVYVQGGGDGSFDDGDAVWFYAAGLTGWTSVIQRDRLGEPLRDDQGILIRHWEHTVHPFSNDNYYFIKIDGAAGVGLEQAPFLNDPSATLLTQVTGRHVVDMDDFLWAREAGGTGHTWVSNLIALGGTLPILENGFLPGLEGGAVTYRARAAIQSNPAASVFFKAGAAVLATANFGGVNNSPTNTVANSGVVTFEQTVSAGQALNLTMDLENASVSPKAALDWARVFYPKALRADGGWLRFHTPIGQTGAFEMRLSGFSGEPQVWDVTEPGAFRRLGVQASGGTVRVQVEVADPDRPRELIAFSGEAVRALNVEEACPVENGCRVTPQNLHGIQNYPTFVIVTPAIFRPFADELADRRRQEGLTVEVVDVQQVYNEFSGGLVDMRAIRDYFKFLYDRAPTEAQLLRYALLFGDGHYNFRERGEKPEFPNWILPFETVESWNPELSYTSDDYFSLLDDDEGVWPYTRTVFFGNDSDKNERVDIGIGRFTVQTENEARVMLDKIKHYESPETYGPWRARYLFLADDGPTGLAGIQDDKDLHTQNTDVVAEALEVKAPEIDQKKIYAISYTREFRNGWRVPGARQDLLTALRDGVLVVNYSGHGGEEGLAQEDLFNSEDARTLQNIDTLPIFITATCSFGRWDLADEQSGAEELLRNPEGGAVALLTTVRTVYTTGISTTTLNVGLNLVLNDELFEKDEAGLPRRLGDALRETKNRGAGLEGNNRKFSLLGDPTMRLGVPSHKAVVTTVNETPVGEQTAPLRALERVTVSGEIQTPGGSFDPGFSGVVNMTVFDAKRQVAIPENIFRYMPRPYYNVREDLIWRGRINATGGRFEATFVVPKDISYSNKPGRITVYAASSEVHAQGFSENVVVGGTTANPPDDAKGPDIELFLNDETFADGGLTPPRPRLIVKLFDDSGINTVGAGVGHEMLLVLDDDEQNAFNIGDLYESEENSFQRGRVGFEFEEDLLPGPHTLSVRAWDVLNNSGSARLDFVVSDDEALVVRNVFNYPNPTTGPTRFVFEHNQPVGTPVQVQIRIYSLAGRPIRTLEHDEILPGGPMQIVWDGTDDDFDRLVPGVYLYKVRVEVEGADGDRQVSETIEKLAVVR